MPSVIEPFPAWYEAVENVCIGALGLAGATILWAAVDHRSRAARQARELLRRRGVRRALVMGVAASIFIIAAEDVLDGEPHELLLRLDLVVRETMHWARSHPLARALASVVSKLTGPGLAGGLIIGALGLVAVNRRRDALVVAGGTLSAWLVSAGLKLTFGIPRPGHGRTLYAISGYGFPSAHALVAVVGCGLLAWSIAAGAPALVRRGVYAGAGAVAAGAGISRVVLDAHWLSDVIAGLALGVIWLNAVLLAVAHVRNPAREQPG
ncbi:MAG TPA: phosphatase PAP2 family protein [Methylomirabilota bacterium]|nr:phosphatase PAP2 family protein [Methylomirabilota bacterium]